MKSYDKCPKCGTINNGKWVKGLSKRPYFAVICTECSNVYYQRFTDQEANDRGIKLNQPDPVHSIVRTNTIMDLPVNEGPLPDKSVKRTTSQARL